MVFSKPERILFWSELAKRCFLLGNWNVQPSAGGMLVGDFSCWAVEPASWQDESNLCVTVKGLQAIWELIGEEVVTFLRDWILNPCLGCTKTERRVMLYLKYSSSSTQIQKCGNGISFFPKSSSCNQTWILKQLQQTTTKTWDTWDVTFLYPTTKKFLKTPCFPVDSKRKPLDKVVHVFGP